MSILRQAGAITWSNLRTLPQRRGSSMVILVGVAGVVGVLIAMLSLAEGFRATLSEASHADRALVLLDGATSESVSRLSAEQVELIKSGAAIEADPAGRPLASAELLLVADLPRRGSAERAGLPVRGVQAAAFQVRPEVALIAGRAFVPGLREVMVGRSAAAQFAGLEIGAKVNLRESEWTVVGHFSAGGSFHESEIWTDLTTIQSAFRRPNAFQSVLVKLTVPAALSWLNQSLAADPRLADVKAQSLPDYLAAQSQTLIRLISAVGYAIGLIMAIGAVFCALNTMYTAVSARQREIATLRALGFGALPLIASVLVEALLLALAGGLIGACLSAALFNGYTVSTLNGATFSQTAFAFRVTPALIAQGLVWSFAIGLVGGIPPAIRVARLPVSAALRAA